MGTRNDPGDYDCASRAEDDEPTFTLLARDVCAPGVIMEWADQRVRLGKNTRDDDQITEAIGCAVAMAAWSIERAMRADADGPLT